jgi:hypothetical protein
MTRPGSAGQLPGAHQRLTRLRDGRRGLRTAPDLIRSYVALPCHQPKGAPMLERDGYLPGVPCWVDTSQPDPEVAVAFYGGLLGWDFEDAMPPGSAGKYFIARLRGGDVAAVASQPQGAPGQGAPRRADCQRTWFVELQQPEHSRSRGREVPGEPGARQPAGFTSQRRIEASAREPALTTPRQRA